jgi:uncharacterized protein (DUF2225 family)
MSWESPLFLSKVECPVCGSLNEYETIRVGAYTEGERDTDFCPTAISWRNPKYQKYHPLLFFTATCSGCFYTREFNAKFKEWGKDNNFRAYRLKAIRDKHLGSLSVESSFVKTVGGMLDADAYPNETAILKLLLAIYDESLNDHPSNLDLGRFYLRTAWIFRHLHSGSASDNAAPIAGFMPDIERSLGDIRTTLAALGRNAGYLTEAVEAHLDNAAKSPTAGDSGRERTKDIFSRLERIQADGQAAVSDLEQTLRDLSGKSAKPSGAADPGCSYKGFASFEECLAKFLRVWDGVPRSEMEAMRYAVRYYVRAYENGKEVEPGNPAIQAAYLIAELSRKFGDHDTARQYFNTTIKLGQEFINQIRGDRTRTALARKLLELAMAQGKKNLAEAK